MQQLKLFKEYYLKHITHLNGRDLSFADIPEYKRTKHVHRLHPYLGKFIPQLVEVFLKYYFKKGDWILDPFMGSGTTLIEANILNINSVGLEISLFNCLITKTKIKPYDLSELEKEIMDLLSKIKKYSNCLQKKKDSLFCKDYEFYYTDNSYLNTWFSKRAVYEMLFYRNNICNYKNQDILKIILSRAARSSRQIAHYDLARPKKPIKEAYWCIKHKRICKPVGEALKFINRYSLDTIKRLKQFDKIRTNSNIKVIQGDSRTIGLTNRFDGIFTSPPYVGLINYHDQHRYAYELFKFKNNEINEIGSATKGRNLEAKRQYKNDIIKVFKNVSQYLKSKAKIFIVVNDRDNLYPEIAEICNFKLKEIYHRPVLMRTERDNNKFSESIYYFIKG